MHYHKLLYIAIYYHVLVYIAINYDIWPYFAIYYQTSRNITRYYYIIPVCHRGLWRLACCTQYRLCGVRWMANPAHTRALPGRARKTLKSTDCEELRGKFFFKIFEKNARKRTARGPPIYREARRAGYPKKIIFSFFCFSHALGFGVFPARPGMFLRLPSAVPA